MFLAVDIGNSSVKLGVHDGGAWAWTAQTAHDFESLRRTLSGLTQDVTIDEIGVASVAPAIESIVVEILGTLSSARPVHISHTMRLPFSMGYATPETLGTDRIAAVAGALALPKSGGTSTSMVVIDAGTAITIDVVSSGIEYLGGSISPGPDLLRAALARGTAQLPEVDWIEAESPIGSSTMAAIQAGLVIPFLAGFQALLQETADQLQDKPDIIATGGWSVWLADRLPEIGRVEPHLVLDGIRELVKGQAR